MRVNVFAALSCVALSCCTLFIASPAFACGGLFCSQTAVAPTPVDQTAERIVFEVDEVAEKITAHVQIQYTGSADQFAWVVPVPPDPEIGESTDAFITELDQLTQPTVTLPSTPNCPGFVPSSFDGGGGGGGCGLGCASYDATAGDLSNAEELPEGQDPVTVHQRSYTSNYEFAVISAAEASDLVEWLQENHYNVSDNMIPVMQPYVDEELVFLGLKLRDGRLATDIVPIKMTYDGVAPMIPIQLTAVAAQPHMGIIAMIVGDSTYRAENYEEVLVATDELAFDTTGRTNYFDWVARRAADADGQLVVKEAAMNRGQQKVTRFYTRLSPHHMTVDPMFVAETNDRMVSPVLDLTERVPVQCRDQLGFMPVTERLPSVCAFNFCGVGATCLDVDGIAHCDCPDGQISQSVQGPDGTPRVTCEPRVNPFGITPEAAGVGTMFDPCGGMNCGAGACVVKSGFPTCLCDEGAVSCISPTSGSVECIVTDLDVPTYGSGAGPESLGSDAPLDSLKQFETEKAAGMVLILVFGLWGWWVRREFKK